MEQSTHTLFQAAALFIGIVLVPSPVRGEPSAQIPCAVARVNLMTAEFEKGPLNRGNKTDAQIAAAIRKATAEVARDCPKATPTTPVKSGARLRSTLSVAR